MSLAYQELIRSLDKHEEALAAMAVCQQMRGDKEDT
jgi:hypothetical protein